MEKLNIENLFNCKTGHSQVLDVKTLINTHDNSFDIKKLIDTREQKRKKLIDAYTRSYAQCINKISVANTLGKNDLLYSVASYVKDVPNYRSDECLKYIEQRIKSLYMDTYIVNKTTIFITWAYIEANIKIEDEKNTQNNSES